MASYSSQYYTHAVPIPAKGEQYPSYYHSSGSAYSVSPPEDHDASVTSGAASYGNSYSVGDSTYDASSSGDWDSSVSASGVDFNDYIQDRFAQSFDPIPLDRSLAVQAQTSGQMNNKHRELLELQAKAQARLAKSRARFAEGVQDAQEVRANLEWTSKKVSSMKTKASRKHSKEYKKARERYPSPEF
ncbi:Biogenesis of lysosome-related organelles complex 1 subunit KXD1 [Seiridium cupressi]